MNILEKMYPTALIEWCKSSNIDVKIFYDQMLFVSNSIKKIDIKKIKIAIKLSKSRLHNNLVHKIISDAIEVDMVEFYKPIQTLLVKSLFLRGDASLFDEVCYAIKYKINIKNITIKTPNSLSVVEKSKIETNLTQDYGYNIEINYIADESIILGDIMFINSKKIDKSISGRLNNLINQLKS